MSNSSPQVLIVGGGFSGIAAAKKLHESGISFQVLEARERLGGRVYTKSLTDTLYVDFGGQWIGPTQDRMYALCREFGIEYFETYNQGKNILELRGRIRTYSGVIPRIDPVSLLNLDWIIRKLNRLAGQIDLHSPWTHPKAGEFDSLTLENFLKKNCLTTACYHVIRVGCETIFACELTELSLLHALFYIKSGTSLDCLINIQDGAQQHRIKGGMQTIVNRMAETFSEKIHFNSPVRKVETTPSGVQVTSDSGTYTCQKVIFAVPPPLLSEIEIIPGLSWKKKNLLQNYPMGRVGKCFMIYKTPFWRKAGFSGQAVSDTGTPFQTLFDCSPADSSYGILMGFTIGDRAKAFFERSKEDRKSKLLSVLISYFGQEAAEAIRYEDFTMTDETWSRGCYAALMPAGAWTAFQGAYQQAEGPFHFAGTEAATRWHGYIEGAVLAGEAAANEILASLKK
jgi:monoamine oxidase